MNLLNNVPERFRKGMKIATVLFLCLAVTIVYSVMMPEAMALDTGNTASITYNANGGTGDDFTTDKYEVGSTQKVLDNLTGEKAASSNPGFTRDGYTFLGWSDDKDATEVKYVADDEVEITADGAKLYAIWKADTAKDSATSSSNKPKATAKTKKAKELKSTDGDDITTDVTLGASGTAKAKTINVGANAMKICSSGWNKADGQYLYYGAYNNTPVKYRVLDRHNSTSNSVFNNGTATMTTAKGDYLLLDSDAILFTDQFDSTSPYSNDYSGSDIVAYLKDGNDVNGNSLFSTKEASAIADTSLAASTETYRARDFIFKDYAASGKSFLLSDAEATQLYYGDNARIKKNGSNAATWWLRSANTSNTDYAGYVYFTGILDNGDYFVNVNFGVSPASNLNLGSVIFTSASVASKTSALAKTTASTDNTWKTTLKDTTKTIKTTGTVTRSGQTVSVPYTYTGSDVDQVSIVITSGDITSSDSSVLYYGKLDGATSASGTGTFTMPSGLPSGYKAYVLAEDVNDWMYTDYASSPVEISIPAQAGDTTDQKATVTFDSNGGSDVTAESVESGKTATEPVDPTREGYVFDGWYTDADCTIAYDFSSKVTEDITLYAKWAAPETKSSIDKSYTATDDLNKTTDATGAEKDEDQKNYQQSEGSTKDNFTYKAFEWTDKAAGKGKITISTKTEVKNQKGAVYAFTKCTAHGFTENIAASNIKYLVEHYGSVDLVIQEGPNKKDTVVFKNVKLTDTTEIKALLDTRVTFGTAMHYNMALYSGLSQYLEDNDPYVVYTSFDSSVSDTLSAKPKTTDDIWDKLKAYKADGRYFSMGVQGNPEIAQVTTASAADSIRAGLADPSVFVSMTSLTTTAATKCDFAYDQTFQSIEDAGGHISYSGVTVSDTVSGAFTIDKATSNKTGTTIKTDGNTVTAGFSNLDSSNVGEVYIDVTLKDTTDTESINKWIASNNGDATVTYTDKDGKTQTSTVGSPEAYYAYPPSENKFNITTDATNGTIDEDCTVGEGNNKTINYSANEGYTLKSVTVDGETVDISKYPDSYTFNNVTKDHDIKVVYAKAYDITTSVTGGTIDNSSKAEEGSDKTINYSPSDGYELKSITIDGIKVDISKFPSSYTFINVTSDHIISVVYAKKEVPVDTYAITTKVTGGKIDDSITGITKGDSKTINYSPSDGYTLKSVTVDGVAVDITKYPSSYTFTGISANHIIDVVYEIEEKYTITTSVKNGKIDDSITGITKGDSKTISYSPSKGYELKNVTVDGADVDISKYPDKYTFKDITSDHEIKVVYAKKGRGQDTDDPGNNLKKPNGGNDGDKGNSNAPDTGDQNDLVGWIAMLLATLTAAVTIGIYRKRADEESEE